MISQCWLLFLLDGQRFLKLLTIFKEGLNFDQVLSLPAPRDMMLTLMVSVIIFMLQVHMMSPLHIQTSDTPTPQNPLSQCS